VQAMPRNARIDDEEVCHVVVNIGPSTAPCIATKERISPQGKHVGYRHSFVSCGRKSAMNFACTALLVLSQQLTSTPDRP
jgi:hypothetical protein